MEKLKSALQNSQRLQVETSIACYQRYERHPKMTRNRSPQVRRKNLIRCDGKRILWSHCRSKEHCVNESTEKSMKTYARRQLKTGTPPVTVNFEISWGIVSINASSGSDPT